MAVKKSLPEAPREAVVANGNPRAHAKPRLGFPVGEFEMTIPKVVPSNSKLFPGNESRHLRILSSFNLSKIGK
jgi:hypothetical protein